MVATILTGPDIVAGSMFGIPGSSAPESAEYGPSLTYQGDALPDIHFNLNKDNILPGSVRSFLNYPYSLSVDSVPAALSAVNIAAAQNVTSGTAMTLAAASTGIATNIPILPFGTSAVVNGNIAIDYGFQNGNCTSGSATITVSDSGKFVIGEPLVIANVGNAGGTSALLTNVSSTPTATTITVTAVPQATNAAAPIGTGNNWSALTGGNGNSNAPIFFQPYIAAGAALLFDPTQGISRGIRITGAASGTGGTFTVSGYDIYSRPQTALITVGAGAVTGWSTKTFKIITSIVPNFTDAHNYSVGTSDVFGLNIRNDKWEYDNFYWAGAFLTTSTGWTAADATSPATASTGDVRGTIQIGTNGPLGSGASGGASNGTSRLALFSTIPLWNLVSATPNSPNSLFGTVPA